VYVVFGLYFVFLILLSIPSPSLLFPPLETAYEQINFQDGLVDGAEIEAAYEHSVNLLQKQCATFDQVVCRCVNEDRLGHGHGCDGKDSNCNDIINNCDEDVINPMISLEGSVGLCSDPNLWFASTADAKRCIEENTVVTDDCQPTTYEVAEISGTSCDATRFLVTASETTCLKSSVAPVTVNVDGTARPDFNHCRDRIRCPCRWKLCLYGIR